MLEAADMVVPDQVYDIYRDLMEKPLGYVSLESICANPWTYPNLIKDPRFQNEVRQDGRFAGFLEHYEFM